MSVATIPEATSAAAWKSIAERRQQENDRLLDAIRLASKLIWSHPTEAEQILSRSLTTP